MDRRLLLANTHVAAIELKGSITSQKFVQGEVRQVNSPLADIWRSSTKQTRDRQLVFGDAFRLLEIRDGMAFGQSTKDQYVGYIDAMLLSDAVDGTHFVSARASHLYPIPDLKSVETMPLTFGAKIRIVGGQGDFFEIHTGQFIPKPHVRPLNAPLDNPANTAQLFFGSPYLWGGNSSAGIDCSGLIQVALLTSGIECPGDSDLQEQTVGIELAADQSTERGDLIFWKGHVAMAVDNQTVIHANAHSMSVTYEPIDAAIERVANQGGGPVTSRRRP